MPLHGIDQIRHRVECEISIRRHKLAEPMLLRKTRAQKRNDHQREAWERECYDREKSPRQQDGQMDDDLGRLRGSYETERNR